MECPDGCGCFHDQTWSANVIQCGRRAHSKVPEFLPMDATAIYLDGLRLGDVSAETFIGRKHLAELYLNGSAVTALGEKTLDGLDHLRSLHLEDNRLESLRGGEFAALSSLAELDLSRNRLSSVHPSTFDGLGRLRVLRLAGNRLATFPLWRLVEAGAASLLPHLAQVSLSGNPWSCECAFLRRAQLLLRDRRDLVGDAGDVRCTDPSGAGSSVAVLEASCSDDVMAASSSSSSSSSSSVQGSLPVAKTSAEEGEGMGGEGGIGLVRFNWRENHFQVFK